MSPPAPPRIAIVGGGPAGLTLGCLLHKRNIPFTVFELRAQPTEADFAAPAGSLDLHNGSGLDAVRECGVYDEFLNFTHDCTEHFIIADKAGEVIHRNEEESGRGRPEISRLKILQLFLAHIPASACKWDHKLLSATRSAVSGSEEIELDFGSKGKHSFDLVIGADGAWSKVRNLLTDVKPSYSGFHWTTASIRQITTKHPHLASLIGTGSFIVLGNHHGIVSQRSTQDSARIYTLISTSDEHFGATTGLESVSPAQAKDVLLGPDLPFGRWGANLKELLEVACDDEALANPTANFEIRPLYSLPEDHTWPHRRDATLIGDAAHLQNPPNGKGVNIAMQDAMLLARAIVKAHESVAEQQHPAKDGEGAPATSLQEALDKSIAEFEVDMARRAKEVVEETRPMIEVMFSGDDGARAMVDWFHSMMGGSPPGDAKPEDAMSKAVKVET